MRCHVQRFHLHHGNTSAPKFTPDRTGFFIPRLEAFDGLASGFSNVLVAAAQKCDADANGVVNQIDIQLIQAALGPTAGPNDPRDPRAAGSITAGDLTFCQNLILSGLPTAGSTPASLTFTGPVGTTPASQPLTVTSSGVSFTFTVTTDQSWLTASPSTSTTAGAPLTVGVNTTGLGAQTLHGNVIVTSSGAANSPLKIPVTLSLVNATIAVSAGNPQVANVSAAFATSLQVLVTDTSHNPLQGQSVVFTAPSTAPAEPSRRCPHRDRADQCLRYRHLASVHSQRYAGELHCHCYYRRSRFDRHFALTNAVPGDTSLGGEISGKSGPTNARVWTFEVGNDGPGSALNTQITGLTLFQTGGAACSPIIKTVFPVNLGNIAPQVVAPANVTIDFTGCASTANFKLTVPLSANNGAATGTIVRLNEFQ